MKFIFLETYLITFKVSTTIQSPYKKDNGIDEKHRNNFRKQV